MHTFRFHLLGLAHLPQARRYSSCAYTQKNLKLARMLTELGHEVYFYGSEGSDVADYCGNVPNFHFCQTHQLSDIARDYGDGDNRYELGYDWSWDFRHDLCEKEPRPSTQIFRESCIQQVKANAQPDDFLLLTMGLWHQPIADAVGLRLRCETGIGYMGSSAANFRAFEAHWLRHFAYASEHPYHCGDGNPLDRVIPNYFDPDDFEFRANKEDYHLYLGRMIRRKGIQFAVWTCNKLGIKLLLAGQGGKVLPDGRLKAIDFELEPGTWEYLGPVGVEERKKLLAGARCAWCPTIYLEPFCGVHIEALLSGTPVITTDFGIFPETVPDCVVGRVGFRCNTLPEFELAARRIEECDPGLCRHWAEPFLMGNVANRFQIWFEDIYDTVIRGQPRLDQITG